MRAHSHATVAVAARQRRNTTDAQTRSKVRLKQRNNVLQHATIQAPIQGFKGPSMFEMQIRQIFMVSEGVAEFKMSERNGRS